MTRRSAGESPMRRTNRAVAGMAVAAILALAVLAAPAVHARGQAAEPGPEPVATAAPRRLAAAPAVTEERCVVIAVTDAVTLTLRCGGRERAAPLPGVRAPRPGGPHAGGEPFAIEGRREVERWLLGAELTLRAGGAWLEGRDLRRELLARGLALLDAGEAQGAELAALRGAEREARSRGLGAWSHAAWRAHQASVTEPVPLPGGRPPPPAVPLAARAARPGQPSWEERKAAFDAAIRELARSPGATTDPPR